MILYGAVKDRSSRIVLPSFGCCAGADAGYFSEFVIHRHFPLHSFQEYVFLDPLYHFIYVLISADICKLEWSVTTHFFGISFPLLQDLHLHMEPSNLINYKKIRTCDSRTAFTRNLISFCYINDEDGCIYQLRTECCRQVISAAFDKKKFNIRGSVPSSHLLLPDSWKRLHVWPCEGIRLSLHQWSFYRKNAVLCKELGVFFCVDIICDDTNAVILCHLSWQCFNKCCFSGTHRSSNPIFTYDITDFLFILLVG